MELLEIDPVERQNLILQAHQTELAERIRRAVPKDTSKEVLPGLFLHNHTAPTPPKHGVSDPSFCVIAQGSKDVRLGNNVYRYDPSHYLLVTAELPFTTQIVEASEEEPYLSMVMQFDANMVSSVIIEAAQPAPRNTADINAIHVSNLDAPLLDAVLRLVRLAEAPGEARVLAPLIQREIIYRLLMGEQSGRLRHLATLGGQSQRIIGVIKRLKEDYHKPLRVEDLAQDIGMSVSGFHHHFKAVTAMSPVQFQKHLRLQEARRLILTEQLDAATAGFRVGYDNASHFSREYKSLFGNPPMRDADQLRGAGV